MKKNLFVVVFILMLVVMVSCLKSTPATVNCTGPTAVSDTSFLLNFANRYGITPVADSASWVYYQILNPGTGATPNANSIVYVRYAARLMDGTYFDSTATDVAFPLSSLIQGWQIGLPKIKTGGNIKLLIPSALGYGCMGSGGVVPSNAPLYFNIYLDSLK